MAIADILFHTIITGFTPAEEASIKADITKAYNGSPIFANMFEKWIATDALLDIKKEAGVYKATRADATVHIDPDYLKSSPSTGKKELLYINDSGEAVAHTQLGALVHEIMHIINNKGDNWDLNKSDFLGDNQREVNKVWSQLGLEKEISYVGQVRADGLFIKAGYQYTDGVKIGGAVTGDLPSKNSDGTKTYSPNYSTKETNDLLIGSSNNNKIHAGSGNDILYGLGGNDELYGDDGTDTAVYFGSPLDYDIKSISKNTWSVENIRGAKNEGADKLVDIEKIRFAKTGETFNLEAKGLKFQNDFALVIDTTGSMGSSINSVKSNASALIDAAFGGGKYDARIGVVGFKDVTEGEPSSVILKFSDDPDFAVRKSAALSAINSITVGGGGDIPETAFDGLHKALDGAMGQWRVGAGTQRIALFTDAPAKDGSLAGEITSLAKNYGATVLTHSSLAAAGGSVDTFTLSSASGLSSESGDDEDIPPLFMTADAPMSADPLISNIEIYTIFTGPAGTDTAALKSIAGTTGGKFLTTGSNDELVKALMDIITAPADPVPSGGGGEGGGGAIPIGAAPVAVADSYAGSFGSQLVVAAAAGVLANDTLQGDGSLKVVGVNGTIGNVGSTIAGSYGSLVLAADGSFTYTPDATKAPVSGTVVDHFTYRETGNGLEALANLDITLTAGGPGTATPLSTLVHDATSPGGQAYALYQGLLGRAPDAAGLQALTTALTNGTSLHDATQALLASPEGQSHFGGLDNAGFVAQLYQEVLNRPADSAGLASATAALDHGLSRAALADNFVFSPEHLGQLQPAFTAGISVPDPHAVSVAQAYYSLLGRAPDASGLQAYAGASLHDVAEGLMHSTEYASLHGMTSDTAYVAELYQHLLGRAADSTGAQTWTAALAGGTDRAGVANALLDSAEFQGHYAGQSSAAYVEALYQHVLGRSGDTAGVQTWANALDHGASRTDVAHAFTASAEFQAQTGGQSDAAFLEDLYTHALGRSADVAGEQAWLSALSHGASRADVVAGLMQSAEGQAHLTAQIAHDWHLT